MTSKKSDKKDADGPIKAEEKAETQEPSAVVKLLVTFAYICSSQLLTFINKVIYNKYSFKSPLILLFVQCCCNIFICMCAMGYKTYVDQNAFQSLSKIGLKISTFPELATKFDNGLRLASIQIVQVLFGLFSVRFVNIPMFLTFRRCCSLATVTTNYFLFGNEPSTNLLISIALQVGGALIAGYDTLFADGFGYLLIWGNNYAQAFQNILASKYNADKKVGAFDMNFFFALIGLPLSLAISLYTGEIEKLQDVFLGPKADMGLGGCILISGAFGIGITVSSLLTTTLCGPFAVNFAGSVGHLFLTFAGFMMFDDATLTTNMLIGLVLSFTGAAHFCVCKYQELQAAKKDDKQKADKKKD